MTEKIIRVGVGVIALNEQNQFLMGKRKNSLGTGKWGIPGGHVEFNETLEETAIRETLEETGLELTQVRILTAATHIFPEQNKHYVAVYCIGRISGQPAVREPDKVEEWQFINSWDDMPQPTFVDYQAEVSLDLISTYLKN